MIAKVLYYAQVIDDTMSYVLNDIKSTVIEGTTATKYVIQYFMDDEHGNPNTQIIFQASDMILQTNSGAVYLVVLNVCSSTTRCHYCGNHDGKHFNGPIHVLVKIIKYVMASAMESEIEAIYMNPQLVMIF